ncbi:MAG: NADH-quinone oxidoreductase subunit NuoE [Deltaproteobacteria bacterium]|jgi:NADH-quinone oxidoreductase subunit E|nr:NADH-quinone oxidoreductase subunit NuoE [Deltaproteobacteria bacterium]
MTDLPATNSDELDPEEQRVLAAIEAELPSMPAGAQNLIPILQRIQQTHGYLPRGGIYLVARHLGLAPSKVFGVATFYNQFRFNPPGRHPIKVCLGTACHVKGGEIILENFARRLGIEEGETTKDREYSLERVACVGCCALAPVVVVGEKIESYVTPSKVEGIITEIEVRREMAAREEERNES